ncbi:MAG: hypothetical protein ACKO0U_11930, partial [Gammaproteobacteria bacterium]
MPLSRRPLPALMALAALATLAAAAPAGTAATDERAKTRPATRTAPPATTAWTAADLKTAAALRDQLRAGSEAFGFVRDLTTEVGPRSAGSAGDAAAVKWAVARLEAMG